jgi:hypothetical protein
VRFRSRNLTEARRIALYVERDAVVEVEALAREEGVSISAFARRALLDDLRRRARPGGDP